MSFSIANVVTRAFDMLRRHALLIIGLNILLTGVPQALKDAVIWLPDDMVSGNWFFTSGLGLIAGLMAFVHYAVVTLRVMADFRDKPFRFGDAFTSALLALIPLVLIAVFFGLMVSLGLILLIVPGIIVAIAFSLSFAVYVAEPRAGLFGAMTRSWRLTENRRWPLFAIYLIAMVMTGILNRTLDAPVLFLQDIPPYLPPILAALVNAVTDVIIVVFSLSAYLCIREDTEGKPAETTADVFS